MGNAKTWKIELTNYPILQIYYKVAQGQANVFMKSDLHYVQKKGTSVLSSSCVWLQNTAYSEIILLHKTQWSLLSHIILYSVVQYNLDTF